MLSHFISHHSSMLSPFYLIHPFKLLLSSIKMWFISVCSNLVWFLLLHVLKNKCIFNENELQQWTASTQYWQVSFLFSQMKCWYLASFTNSCIGRDIKLFSFVLFLLFPACILGCFTKVQNVYLTSWPWFSSVVAVTSGLECSFKKKKKKVKIVLQAMVSSHAGSVSLICWDATEEASAAIPNPIQGEWNFVSGAGRMAGLMCVIFLCVCGATLQLLLPPLSHSISCVTHEISQNEIILHHGVGTWKPTFSWNDNKSNYFQNLPVIC